MRLEKFRQPKTDSFYINDGFASAYIKSFLPTFLSKDHFVSLSAIETVLKDFCEILSDTDYAENLLALDEDLSASTIYSAVRKSYVQDINDIMKNSSSAMRRFYEQLRHKFCLENAMAILVQAVKTNKQKKETPETGNSLFQKTIDKCHPLGFFSGMKTLFLVESETSVEELLKSFLPETELVGYFEAAVLSLGSPQTVGEFASKESHVLFEQALFARWLETFFTYSVEIVGRESATDLVQLLEQEADFTNLLLVNAEEEDKESRSSLLVKIGLAATFRTNEWSSAKSEADFLRISQPYKKLVEKARDKEKDLEEVFEEEKWKHLKSKFLAPISYAPFYCFVMMKEIEIKRLKFVADCVEQQIDGSEVIENWEL